MHELSIATEIVNIVNQHVKEEERERVEIVKVKIGRLTNVLGESLQFCYDAIIKDTPLANAKLEIENTLLQLNCNDCGNINFADEYIFKCKACSSGNINITGGDELNVSEIILKDLK